MDMDRSYPTHWHRALRRTVALLATVRGRPRRVVVSGASMLPSFEPGDRLIVVPVSAVRPGQVVALADPGSPGRLLVKRVRAVGRAGIDVRGDNEGASTDSRTFGPVPPSSITGRVIYRYHPAARAGWLAG